MRRTLIAVLSVVLALGLVSAQAAAPRDPYKHFFNETWGDLPEELQNARKQGKDGIFIFFEMDECPFCHYMKSTVLNQPEVQEYFRKHFLNFTVDIEGDVEVTDFDGEAMTQKEMSFKKYRVRATPVLAFFDLDGKQVLRYTGKTSGQDEFMWMGEFVAQGLYKKMPFTRYKRQKRQAAR